MDALISQVRQLGAHLATAIKRSEFDLEPIFENLTQVAGEKRGRLLDIIEGGHVVINSNHPGISKLTDGRPGRVEVLTSAIISLVNRAEMDLTDEHQHKLHRFLVAGMIS